MVKLLHMTVELHSNIPTKLYCYRLKDNKKTESALEFRGQPSYILSWSKGFNCMCIS